MRVIVVGAGQVGQAIAADLAEEHEVVVVEIDRDLVDELTYSLDVLPIHGDGTDLSVLRQADVEDADLLIAATDSDETNIVVCGAAKTTGDVFTIARVRRRNLLQTWRNSTGSFGVDFMVCTDLLTAEAIFRLAGLPGAQDVDTFASGLVRMAEFHVDPDGPIAGQTVSEADRYDSLTFAAVFRGEELIIPTGETVVEPNDSVVVIGSPESIRSFSEDVTDATDAGTEEVVIMGGTELGFQTARLFSESGVRTRLIERDHDRARELAEALPDVTVMESDATDTEFLLREHVDDADMVATCFDTADKNLLISLLVQKFGVDRTVAVVDTAEYADLFEAVGVDVAINPREKAAEEIVRFTHKGSAEKIAMLEHDRAEVLEVVVDGGELLAGRRIQDVVDDLPDRIVIGAITRDGELVTPRGDTTIRRGDHVVLFAGSSVLSEVFDRL